MPAKKETDTTAGIELPPKGEESQELRRKVDVAVGFLRWLADATRGDYDLRQRTVRCLMEMDEWRA